MRTSRELKVAVLAAVVALAVGLGLPMRPAVHAQGYSGAVPNVTETAATGLGLTYTAGVIASGGAQQAITAGTLTATDSMTSCAAPAYSACNFVYWNTSTSLLDTTSLATASLPGNVIVAYVTTTGGNVTKVTPAAWVPAQPSTLRATQTDRFYTVSPASNCGFTPTTTAADTGTWPSLVNIATNENVWAYQTNSTSGTVEVLCNITPPPTESTVGAGYTLTGMDVRYAIVTTSATLGAPTVATVTGPATVGGAAAGAVASAGGSLTVTPASLQGTAITSGLMYRENIAFGTPIAWNTAYRGLTFDQVVTTAGGGSTKTRIDLYGITVYYEGAP